MRTPGCVVRPAVHQRLVSDAAETVRGRVQVVHVGAVHRRPAQAQPVGLGRRRRPFLVADRAAVQRVYRVHHVVRSGRTKNDTDAKRPF